MGLLETHINNLTQSSDANIEKNNATTLNDFSTGNHISYGLSVFKDDDDKAINIADLEKNIDEKLKITIKAGDFSKVWSPLDNNNIYILLRE